MSATAPPGSIERRLPFVVSLLLLVVLGVFSLAAHREVRDALSRAAEARLQSASDRLGTLLEQTPRQLLSSLRAARGRPGVAALLTAEGDAAGPPGSSSPAFAGGADARAAATAALDSLNGSRGSPGGILLLARDGRPLAAVGDTAGWAAAAADAPTPGLGPIVRVEGVLLYAGAVPVIAGADTVGRLVEVRRLASNPDGGQTIADLIGEDAVFLLGNRAGDVWTDLARPTTGPPPDTRPGVLTTLDTDEAGRLLGITTAVAGTPWVVWVALPETAVMAPLAELTARMTTVVVLLVIAGAMGAWLLGRWITRPLVRLGAAAGSIARGDYSLRVRSDRSDEIGVLASAFDDMAGQVEEARDRLEHRVAERTAELEAALDELRDAQEELVRKERLALLGELAGGVGHELRNPLGVMTNAVFYLKAVLQQPPGKVEEYLDILSRQIHLSEKIVSDLLDFARVKPPETRPVELAELADRQVERAGPPDEVEVRWEFPSDLPPASVDPDQVGQVVLNLVTNAVQAMEDGGGGVLTLRGAADNGTVRLDVVDTGPGIPDEVMAKIFEPLFTTRARGIGLGLSVSRSLAEANGGTLAATSEVGRGTTFSLTLPAADGGAAR